MILSAWLAIGSVAALATALVLRRTGGVRSPFGIIAPLAVLALSLDHLIPRTPATQLAAMSIVLAMALVAIAWLLWRIARDPDARPAALALPLLALIAALPPLMGEFFPRLANRLDWSAAMVASIGAILVWDGVRRWDTDDARKPWLVATVAAGLATLVFGGLLIPPGTAPEWVLIPIGLGYLAALALTVRAYWLE